MLRPRFPVDVPVERGFVQLPHGQVHYRAAGFGPVVLALHESPASSLSLQPLIAGLAGHYRVIAPDTPGYGLSDPLPGAEPALEDFLAVLLQFTDAMALKRVALYGTHTGAALAAAFAARYPQRVTTLVLDGISLFSPDEVEAFRRHYLPSYEPRWDGSHVMQLWSRVKDTFTWFPWHAQTHASRLARDPPSVDTLQRSALGLLQAGRHYTKAYGLSAAFDPRNALHAAVCPVTIMARADDLIADHLDRLGPGPWVVQSLGRDRTTWLSAVLSALRRGTRPDPAVAKPHVETRGSRFLSIGRGWLHVRIDWRASGFIRLLLHGLPGDGASLLHQQRKLHRRARLVAIDLPGCGWSDPLEDLNIENVLDGLDKAVEKLGIQPRCVVGEGASAVIAALWAERNGCRVETVDEPGWLRDPSRLPTRPLLDPLQPHRDGSHLTGTWFRLRDLMLYEVPVGYGSARRKQKVEPPDVQRLQILFLALVEGPQSASLLALVVELMRLWPDLMAVPTLRRARNRSRRAKSENGHADNG